jgi:hypothetical protein
MDVLQSFGNKNPEAEAAKMLHLKLECIAAHVDVCRAHQRISAPTSSSVSFARGDSKYNRGVSRRCLNTHPILLLFGWLVRSCSLHLNTHSLFRSFLSTLVRSFQHQNGAVSSPWPPDGGSRVGGIGGGQQ